MATDLTAMQDALAGLTDAELHALIAASNKTPPIAYGLLVWIEGACDWEPNRRMGHDYELLPPEAAIDSSEDKVSIEAAYVLRDQFTQDSSALRAFFDVLVELLAGSGRNIDRQEQFQSVHDDNQHTAGRVLNERTCAQATPPPRRPTVEVPMADYNQVGANLPRMTGNLLDRIPD